jgi:DNA-binding NtrC family response regulator
LSEVKEGRLREDLYYRLAVIPFPVAPLRERRDDIPVLAARFLAEYTEKYEKYFYDFSAGTMQRLMEYPWPGNVRELQNTIEQIVALNTSSQVIERFLPEKVQKVRHLPKVPRIDQGGGGDDSVPGILRFHDLEKQALLQAVEVCNGNVGEAARRLGIGQATLYRKIKKYGVRN